jgi:IS30 family transposase
MNQEIRRCCFAFHSQGLTYKEIANHLDVSESTICRAITTIKDSHDYKLGRYTASELIAEYAKTIDYFYMQQKKLNEEIKSTVEDVKKKSEEGMEVVDKHYKASKAKYAVKLIDAKLKIMKQ